ncbi:MAG: hypothetical protein J7J94_03740 [Thaumarchaeota archaeon]|nr:hypothetical protein [Nitrososphaerota archaeon]
MRKNSLTIGLAAFSIVCVAALILSAYFWPVVVEGFVDHVGVVGMRNGVARTIFMITPHGIVVKDENLGRLLAENQSHSFNEILKKLDREYEKLYCVLSLRLTTSDPLNDLSPGETLAYTVDRGRCTNALNLDLGSRVKLVITRWNPLEAVEISEVSD